MQFKLPLFSGRPRQSPEQVDALYLFLVLITTFFLVADRACSFFSSPSSTKRTPERKAEQIHGSTLLEIIWTVIPLGISMVIFVWGRCHLLPRTPSPANALEVTV